MYNRQRGQYTPEQWHQLQQQQMQQIQQQQMQQMQQSGQYPNPYQQTPPAGFVKRPGCGCGRRK
jgi:uncharacterized protein (DUF885 family)